MLVASGSGSRCPDHLQPRWHDRTTAQTYDRARGSAHQRGYTRRWRKIRDAYLAGHPLCEWCESKGLVTAATEVDHTVALADGGQIDGALQSMCHPCHMRKTALDEARRAARAPGPAGRVPGRQKVP